MLLEVAAGLQFRPSAELRVSVRVIRPLPGFCPPDSVAIGLSATGRLPTPTIVGHRRRHSLIRVETSTLLLRGALPDASA